MSYDDFKEVSISNPGTSTRYGSDDILDLMKILNAKVVSNRRPEIINKWRWSAYQELKSIDESLVPAPTETDVIHLFLDNADKKLKSRKVGGTTINLEDIGSGTWSNSSTETFSNKTIPIDTNIFKHSTTNAQGDVLRYDTTYGGYIRLARGTANQSLTVNASGTDLEWQTITAGGGGGEANTASNVGSAGIGFFYQKLGVDLEFKKVYSPDASINISDDTGNQKIDLTLGAAVVKTAQVNTYGDFNQTFRSSRLQVMNPANTFAYSFVGSAIAAARDITLPLLSANDTLVVATLAQSIESKTFTSSIISTDGNTIKHSTTNTLGELLVNNGTKFDRKAKGSALQILRTNAGATDIEWATLSVGTINVDTDTVKHSTTNNAGDLLANTGTKYDRFARGTGDQFLKMNAGGTGVEWGSPLNGTFNTDVGTLKHSTTNGIGEILVNTGTKFDRFAKGAALTYLRVNAGATGIEWATVSTTTREVLAASVGGGHNDSMGSSYIDMLCYQIDNTGVVIENTRSVIIEFDVDFTGGFTQYKVNLLYTKDDSSVGDTHDIKIVDASNSSNFFEMLNVNNGLTTKSLTSLAAWMTGVKHLKVQHKTNGTGNTPTMHNLSFYLK